MDKLYIGLMSGTSADGIDAALVSFAANKVILHHQLYLPYSQDLREKIFSLYIQGNNEIARFAELDVLLGKTFAQTVLELIKGSGTKKKITAIGSHGQTIRHHPHQPYPYTLQIGDPNIIAAQTGITTIADFRRKDLAVGGQGAPLVPAFHDFLFRKAQTNRAIVNIGGIANVTFLLENQQTFGFDTGPGNALLDAWFYRWHKEKQDENGNWSREGKVQKKLLSLLLEDKYFQQTPPKSTGREYFNLKWLNYHPLQLYLPVDVQATLVQLTAQTILNAIQPFMKEGEIILCGGGVHNSALLSKITQLGSNFSIYITNELGIDADWVEAMAFAWFAEQTLAQRPANLPAVTGANRAIVLGGIYYA